MIEHVFERAKMFENWDGLYLATCDDEIAAFGQNKGYPVLMTSDCHTRCLDRIAEAAQKCGQEIEPDDIIVCVQGDEPMLHPGMIEAVVAPLIEDEAIPGTVLAMAINSEEMFRNPDTVKIVQDLKGDVLYTSRAPIPYCKAGEFSAALGARRIYGIFAFRWHFLKWFTEQEESPLEIKESCDSNRICDHGGGQRVAPYPYMPSFSVDNPADVGLVESAMSDDPYWGKY